MTTQWAALPHLLHLLRGKWFRRLFAVRLTSQLGDGIFQIALASHVLFSPEKQPSPGAIATTLTVMLLPFSLLGPFAGVFLDRWPRRQVLAFANLARLGIAGALAALVAYGVSDLGFYVVVVLCLSVNRFVLAGLSAALPHTVSAEDLVTANALTPTMGAIAAFIGGLLGTLVRSLTSDEVVLVAAALAYGAAGLLALRIPRLMLGPDFDPNRPAVREAVRHVAVGLAEGARHLAGHRRSAYALLAIASNRFWLGLAVVSGFLVIRNHLHTSDEGDAALRDISLMLGVSAVGFVLAAVLTPFVVERIAQRLWVIGLLVVSAAVAVFPFALYTLPALLVAGFFLGLAAQGIKICVDTRVQLDIDDAFRGRVFSIYDVLFNLAFVGAAAVAAATLPDDGRSYAVLTAVAIGLAATAGWYARVSRGQ